jgi:hypothetical protein
LGPGRLSFSHDHDACHPVLGIKHEAVIQIGENTLQSLFERQVIEGDGDLLLKQGFIPPEPDTRLLLNVPSDLQESASLEVHGKQAVLDGDRIGGKAVFREEEENARNDQNGTESGFRYYQKHSISPSNGGVCPGLQSGKPGLMGNIH